MGKSQKRCSKKFFQIFRKTNISYPLVRTRGVLATPLIILDNFHTSFEMNQEEHLLILITMECSFHNE